MMPAGVSPTSSTPSIALTDRAKASDVVMYSYGLVDVGYRFGGSNPDAGLDCSGMVSYIVQQVTGMRLPHSAREIASLTRPVEREALQPGDLVFFNTLDRPYSHMGIYLGDDRFIHAPSTNGRVRINRLSEAYYARRFDAGRSMFVE